jgi:nitrous oxidase accessory protein
MRKSAALLLVLVLTVSNVIVFLPVKAEARTIVVPDDYPTIASAIGNATEDDTIFVKKGTYEEHSLIINKTLTLIGEDANSTIIKNIDTYDEPFDTSMAWAIPPVVAVEIKANNIKVLNFTVTSNHWFLPINVSVDGSQIVDNIFEPKSEGISVNGNNNTIARNSLSGIGNGFIRCTGLYNNILYNNMTGSASQHFGAIYINGLHNLVYGNTIMYTGDSGFGIIKVYGDENTIAKNNITKSGGISIENGSNNIVAANRFPQGGNLGVMRGDNNLFYANHLENGGVGATIGGKASNTTLYHNNFINNKIQVRMDDYVSSVHHFDNGKEGNYWSDYTGKDDDGDGIGDSPYIIGFTRKDNHPLMAPFNIESVTIELPEWETPSFELPQPEPFPTTLVAASIASVAIIGIGLLVYFKKRKH